MPFVLQLQFEIVLYVVTFILAAESVSLLRLLLLCVALCLPQSTLSNVLVHASVDLDNSVRSLAQEAREEPLHQTMTPVGGAGKSNALCASGATDLAQSCTYKLLGIGYESARLPDLGHGSGDQVRLDALNMYAVGLELRAESSGPLLKEGLAAGVCSQERCREETTERCHGHDKSALARDHTWNDELGNAEGRHAVDHNDVVHLLLWCLGKWHWNAVAQANVVNQDANIQTINQLLEAVVVSILVESEVHGVDLDRHLGAILVGNVGGEGVELGLCSGDEDEVIAFGSERKGEFFADTVRSSSDQSPRATGTKGCKLLAISSGLKR